MPTYREALSANPAAFVEYAAQMTTAGSDLTGHRLAYGEEVAALNMHWQDEANNAFNTEVDGVGAHIDGLVTQVAGTAGQLSGAGGAMATAVTALKTADAAIHAAGFDIQPAPQVTLGAAQRLAIALAGPFGFQLQAALETAALAATTGLQAVLATLNSTDAQTATALSTAAGALQPLGSKTSPTGEDMQHMTAEDHSDAGGPSEEESGGEEESEEEQSGEEEEEQPAEEPQDQQAPQEPQTPQQPTMPETPPGMDDFQQPEMDDPWADSEMPDPEDYSGGLASGGGLGAGGGLGGGGLGPTGGLATGAGSGASVGAGLGAMAGAAPSASAGAPGRSGMGSSMMGAGGGRGGAGAADDELTRESKLLEDPEEDVWGIGGGDDDPYA
ncbi:hypothetical protein [Glycomyces tenuis]|uniref:hypothetical protein n=1 Tax=Glycomyces tenuis TaxID=58116 RepID=UPI000418BE6E|nr:hypothetical protein [Glycomyces tenuis]